MSKENILIKIDNKLLNVSREDTILSAAIKNKIKIPNLCYNCKMTPTESCRLCIIKIVGKNGFFTSCSTKVENNMQIIAFDKELEWYRKIALDLLISTHNDDCINCIKNSDCNLQDLIFRYDLGKKNRVFSKIWNKLKDNSNYSSKILDYDSSKCIQCKLCIKSCTEIQYKNVLTSQNRGIFTNISTGYKNWNDSKCDGCGECIQNCPTAAITSKNIYTEGIKFSKKDIDKIIRTTCPYCGIGCQIDVSVINEKIVKVDGANEVPNYGSLCVKGRFGLDFTSSIDRLRNPLIREGNKFVETSWENAAEIIASKLIKIMKKHGSNSIGLLSSSKCTNEDNYVFQKFARSVINTNNIDNCSRLCHAPSVVGLNEMISSSAMTNPISDFQESDVILIIGSNTTENHPVIANKIKNSVIKNNTKLIVIDPMKTDMVKYAHIWIKPKYGTDTALINGMINIIVNNKLHDIKFINERTTSFDAMISGIKEYTPEYTQKITGVDNNLLYESSVIYSKAKKASTIWAMGITQHVGGTNTVRAITNLVLLTGNIGKSGTGVNPLRGQNNVQGACDMGTLPNYYPGYKDVESDENIDYFKKLWNCNKLSTKKGMKLTDMIENCGSTIKAMYIMGENPVMSDANSNKIIKKLKSLDFLICQDIFLNETSKAAADVILPAKSALEKQGTFTNTERRVLTVNKAINPTNLKNTKPDWEIIQLIVNKMGNDWNYKSCIDILNEINKAVIQYRGITSKRLKNGEKIQWPCINKKHKGTKILCENEFPTKSKKGIFKIAKYIKPNELPDEKYPFLMTTGRLLFHYHTGTMTRRSNVLNEYQKDAILFMNPKDMSLKDIKDGNLVSVQSRRGNITIKVKSSYNIDSNTIFVPFHFSESMANILTNEVKDLESGTPSFKICAVNVVKINKYNT